MLLVRPLMPTSIYSIKVLVSLRLLFAPLALLESMDHTISGHVTSVTDSDVIIAKVMAECVFHVITVTPMKQGQSKHPVDEFLL